MISTIFEKLGLKKKRKQRKYLVDNNYHEVFKYEYIHTLDKDSNDYMIRFSTAKNADHLIGKLLILIDGLDFDSDGTSEMIDEIWINAKSNNGRITITHDIWDMIFILAENNKTDLDRIDAELCDSDDFEKIEVGK